MERASVIRYNESNKGQELFFRQNGNKSANASKSRFFRLLDDPNQIIKYSVTELDVPKTVSLIERFSLVKDQVTKTKLPNALYEENGLVKGTVVPFFENGISLYEIAETHSLEKLSEHYKRDDDNVHNLFLMMRDILGIIEELKDYGFYYTDSNMGNFIFKDNQVHLIDFEPLYMREASKENLKIVLKWYDELLFIVNKRFNLIDLPVYKPKDFKSMSKRLDKVENKVRKNMH